jgi:hypothetical protein
LNHQIRIHGNDSFAYPCLPSLHLLWEITGNTSAVEYSYGKEPEIQFVWEKKANNTLIDLDFFKELQEKAST